MRSKYVSTMKQKIMIKKQLKQV